MSLLRAKTRTAGATAVTLLLVSLLLAEVMPGAAVAKPRPYLGVLAADQERMVGLGRGVLEVQHGCVVLDDALRKPTLVVFPPGYSLLGVKRMRVRDDTGARVAFIGKRTTLHGGYAGQYKDDKAALDALLVLPVPDRCQYDYVFFGY